MISVIVPSHNGARTLPRTLEAFGRLMLPDCAVEFILVDNASSDETSEILAREGQKLDATVLKEPRHGKSYALNTAVAAAKGDLLVFADDDVIPATDWLLAYVDAAHRYPASGIFAGQVRHEWDAQPPQWLGHLGTVGRAYGGTPINLQEGAAAYNVAKGANLMIRRRAMQLARFDEGAHNFSRSRGSVGGEDTALVRELTALGQELTFVPAACVRHIVRAEQIGIWPVFARYVRIGGVRVIHDPSLHQRYQPVVFGFPCGAHRDVRRFLRRMMRELRHRRWNDAAVEMTKLAWMVGVVKQIYSDNRKRRRSEDRL